MKRRALTVLLLISVMLTAVQAGAGIVAGKFGNGFDAVYLGVQATDKAAYSTFPITAECWFKLTSYTNFNILLANRSKTSDLHWEMFTSPGNGNLCAYIPGYSVADVNTGRAHNRNEVSDRTA